MCCRKHRWNGTFETNVFVCESASCSTAILSAARTTERSNAWCQFELGMRCRRVTNAIRQMETRFGYIINFSFEFHHLHEDPHLSIVGSVDLTPEDNIPVGKNNLNLTNIQSSANYTCTAASTLGQIEATAIVKVQCK